MGFTLVELLAVLAVGSIIWLVAVPTLQNSLKAFRSKSAQDALLMSILLARNEAIKRNSRAVLCKSSDGQFCVVAGTWDQGWIVFSDVNNNTLRDAGESVVFHQRNLGGVIKLSGNFNVANYLSYTPMGFARLPGGGLQMGTFTVCPYSTDAVDAHEIVISPTGRPRTMRTKVSNCI